MKKCERCGAKPQGEYELLDYCAVCGKDLCDKCLERGCCGNAPGKSGNQTDNSEAP